MRERVAAVVASLFDFRLSENSSEKKQKREDEERSFQLI